MGRIVQSEKTKYPVIGYLSHLLGSPVRSMNEENHNDIKILMSQTYSIR